MRDLTTGSVTRHLLETAGFMLVIIVFQTLYYLVDLYWVGRLGAQSVAAVGVAGNLMFVVMAVSQMLGVGTTTLVSHAVGQREPERARLVFNQAQALSLVVAVVFVAVASLARRALTHGLAADAATAELADRYLDWFLPAMALQFGIITMGASLRGTGNMRPAVVVQSATVVLNMVLAPFLIFGWVTHRPMGVSGAALATFVSIVVGTLWLLAYFAPKGAYLHVHRADWRPRPDLWSSILRIGAPAGAEFALMSAYLFVVYLVSRPFGAAAQAGFGIGMRVTQAGFMPVIAIGAAVAPLAGQNMGARHADRVRETLWTGLRIAVGVMLAFAVACHIAPAALIRPFSNDPAVIAVGVDYLVVISWNFVAAGVVVVCSSMFQAMGNTVPSLLASCVRIVVAVVPALVLSRAPGFRMMWLWYIGVAAVTAQMLVSASLLRREMPRRLAFPEARSPGVEVASPTAATAEATPGT
jgi:putative MATE family efflux protein